MSSGPTRVVELRALANVEGDVNAFTVVQGDVRIEVAYDSGSASSVTLRVSYDAVARAGPAAAGPYRSAKPLAAARPLAIVLTPELATHVEAKASGMDVEVQTDDEAFDREVYVDSPAPEDVVRAVLGPEVRAAVLELFRVRFRHVAIDDATGRVTATCTTFPSTEDDTGEGVRAAKAFADLARALPVVARLPGQYAKHPLARPTSWLGGIGGVLFFLEMPAFQGFLSHARPACAGDDTPFRCNLPVIVGISVGLGVAAVASTFAMAYARRYRGTSSSSSAAASFAGATLLFTWCVVGFTVGVLATFAGLAD